MPNCLPGWAGFGCIALTYQVLSDKKKKKKKKKLTNPEYPVLYLHASVSVCCVYMCIFVVGYGGTLLINNPDPKEKCSKMMEPVFPLDLA